MGDEQGRRERKKAVTRQRLTDAAVRLFLARGYDAVTVAEVAEEADTALTTLFAHFPDGKQALVFGGSGDRAASLAQAIEGRPVEQDALTAVEEFIAAHGPFDGKRDTETSAVFDLIRTTPALTEYARQRWVRCQDVLARTLTEVGGYGSPAAVDALARFVLESPQIAGAHPRPGQALHEIFDHVRKGWPHVE
ncbi:transcriptional regulator [Curtobacterium sp. MCBD17_013]|uniref:TetR/AcrR family transcriptional regulator n=1 Tax=unclassified Curtobacterium TaxID=257496 RepID=UPI000DAA3D00|nr:MULTISPECIES: TetR/AcrR family transcriptional regulator [unclassified Curtobacterium]PZF63295.1 transcriptional regulator [Curtobacterium sp. MCBD17_013]WIB64286.1 helix-turn-helix domain-containing protein [Curtobacterium sp. MCBD17_040]WIB68147.1 helix-turn-helix domain-containing protein [Curtobacterium sp. MCBD17_035]